MGNKIIRLGDYCDIIKGSTGIKKAIPGEFPLVVTAEERQSHNEYQFDTTAVIIPLVSSTGHGHASIKRLHYQEGKFALGTILCAVLIKDTTIINPRFLYIYLSYFKDHLLVPLMKGAANVTLSIKKIKDVEIILPSLERQLEILDLESNSDLIDELTFEIQTQKQLISQLKQAILQEAIQGKLTQDWREQNPNTEPASELLERIKAEKEQLIKDKKIKKEKPLPPITEAEIPFEIPESWTWVRLGDITLSNAGKTLHKGENTGEYRDYITTSNLYWNEFKLDNLKKIQIEEKELKKCQATKDDLLICEGGDVGRSAIWMNDYDICFQNHIHRVRPILEVDIYFVYYFMMYLYYSGGIKEYKKGMGIGNLSGKALKSIKIPFTSLEEQKAIVEKIETLMEKCNALEQEITQSEQHANMLMQAVLKEAFESNNRHFHKTYKQTGDYIQEQTLSDLFPTQNLYAEVACMLSIEKEMHRKSRGKTWVQKTANHLKEIKKEPKLKDVIFEEYPWGMFSQTIAIAIDSNPFLTIDDVAGVSVYKVRFNKIAELNLWMQEPRNADFVASTRNIVSLYDDPLINNDLNRIELLNTVYRCIQKLNTTDFELIYQAMREWPMQEQGYANKAEKFDPYVTKLMIGFIKYKILK